MARGKMLHMFVGVPDEMLLDIGRLVVLGAQLDPHKMKLFEVASSVPVTESAKRPRKQLNKDLKAAFSVAPFDRLKIRLEAWLEDVANLLDRRDEIAHSVGGYEVRGDGTARSTRLHPKQEESQTQFDASTLNEWVMRMSDAQYTGVGLLIESMVLKEGGVEAHDNHLKHREEYERSVKQLEELGRTLQSDGSNETAS
jgi:hypothetical protein